MLLRFLAAALLSIAIVNCAGDDSSSTLSSMGLFSIDGTTNPTDKTSLQGLWESEMVTSGRGLGDEDYYQYRIQIRGNVVTQTGRCYIDGKMTYVTISSPYKLEANGIMTITETSVKGVKLKEDFTCTAYLGEGTTLDQNTIEDGRISGDDGFGWIKIGD